MTSKLHGTSSGEVGLFRRVNRFGIISAGFIASCLATAGTGQFVAHAGEVIPRHGIAMHGDPALAPDFSHLPYVNPTAPKGGRLTLGELGSYDSLNPFLIRGVSPAGIRGYVYESLMARSGAEPFSLYGLIAESIEFPEDRSEITFSLRPEAQFSDGHPVTAEDVAFSHALLRDHAAPYMRSHYTKVREVTIESPHRIRFVFGPDGDREIPLILGLMPILPKHLTTVESFTRTTLEPPVGSGPMRIGNVDPGRSISYVRNEAYWGRDLPIRRGQFNFDEVRIDFFRDDAALFAAFRTGAIDVRVEEDPTRWSESYSFQEVADGRGLKEALPTSLPDGMLGIVMNTRRAPLDDKRVRDALIRLFDFPWINRTLFNGLYKRSESYFARSELAAVGRTASAHERKLLAPFLGLVEPGVLEGTWRLGESDGTGQDRKALSDAYKLLQEAGYQISGGRLVHGTRGEPLELQFLARSKAEERLMLAYASTLKRLGIPLTIRQVDSAQYWARLKDFDFDLLQWRYSASLSPGNEQINRWASSHADIPGSLNLAGVKNPGVDAMIDAMLQARSREHFEDAVRALDRLLISGGYVIPLFHRPAIWTAHWSRVERPSVLPNSGIDLDTWWAKPGQ